MLRLCADAIAVVSLLVAGVQALAAAADPVADNAALHYWRAFSVFPSLSDKQEESLRAAIEKPGPIHEETAKMIELGRASLKELHRGAACSRCVWGTPLEEGAEVLLPHCAKVRQLVRLACARAHLRFQQHRPAEAIDDLMAAMTLGRHLADDRIIICLMVDFAVERQAIGAAARHLGQLQAAQLDDFAARLDRLPPALTMRQAIQSEKEFLLEGFIRDLSGPNAKEKVAALLKGISDNDAAVSKWLQEAPAEQIRDAAIALRPVYDKIAAMMEGPPAEVKSPETLLAGLNGPARALGMGLLPTVLACRVSEAAHQTRLAMLKAAVAVARHGREALRNESFQDPYGGGPFAYEKTPGGFRLVSKTRDRDGKAVILEVGQQP